MRCSRSFGKWCRNGYSERLAMSCGRTRSRWSRPSRTPWCERQTRHRRLPRRRPWLRRSRVPTLPATTGGGKVWTRAELARVIDHTLLDPAATNHDVLMACEIARRNACAAVCLNSNRVALARKTLGTSPVGIAAVVGFPFGAAHVTAKSTEARLAIDDGATEIDMVIDIGRLKD